MMPTTQTFRGRSRFPLTSLVPALLVLTACERSTQGVTFGGLSNGATDTTTSADEGAAAAVGQWSAVLLAPIVQIHLNLLPNGKVLSWGHEGEPHVWDPATGSFTTVPSPVELFCAGHDFLPEGRLVVTG